MAVGRAYKKGDDVTATRDIHRSNGVLIGAGTPGKVTHDGKPESATVRVKFQNTGGVFRVVPKNCVRP